MVPGPPRKAGAGNTHPVPADFPWEPGYMVQVDSDKWAGRYLADAFGVLPPVSRLTPEQARYHFISGYTAEVAGTERGVIEPKATFSVCFGEPFMARHPNLYAELLGRKIEKHRGPNLNGEV